MKCFRFAVMGCGVIARKFCQAVELLEKCVVVAVSSKSLEKARTLANEFHIAEAYDNYETMLREEKPDCVYIAVTPNAHFELTMLCMDYSVPVLCEKAMFRNSQEASIVFERAKQKNIFVMEALWSRFLPALKEAKKWVTENKIGKITYCEVTLGFLADIKNNYRIFAPELSGGAAYDLTVYAYQIATFFLGNDMKEIQTSAIWADEGIDYTNHVMLRYEEKIASLNTSIVSHMQERIVICGEEGRIEIAHPHYGDEAYLIHKNKEKNMHFVDQETKNGFIYEIQETMQCIKHGKIESEIVPHMDTLNCSKLFDMILATK